MVPRQMEQSALLSCILYHKKQGRALSVALKEPYLSSQQSDCCTWKLLLSLEIVTEGDFGWDAESYCFVGQNAPLVTFSEKQKKSAGPNSAK